MSAGILGKKIGMTQVYDEAGSIVPVTVIQAGPCVVLQVKNAKTDGYDALQLGFGTQKAHRVSKAEVKHCAKAGAGPVRFVRELRLDAPAAVEAGSELKVDVFAETKMVNVIGTSKGKGFAGAVKRHHFRGQPGSHGQMGNRVVGSIGTSADPSRVLKGTRMAGHMGACKSTSRNLKVVSIDVENSLLVVRGAVPGPNGGFVIVKAIQ